MFPRRDPRQPIKLALAALALVASGCIFSPSKPKLPPPPPPKPAKTQLELIQKLKDAYQSRDYDAYVNLFPKTEDGAPFYFFLNEPGLNDPEYWDLTEELRIHRRMFIPQDPLPGEQPLDTSLWLVSIDIQLTPQGDFSTERTDLYRSDANPTGLDPERWRATDCGYTTYVFFKLQGNTDYLVNGKANFVVIEDKTKQVGDDRKFLIYRWEDLGGSLKPDALAI